MGGYYCKKFGFLNFASFRAPYLDDPFVEWINGLPLEIKMDFSLDRGQGEKRCNLLRRIFKVNLLVLRLALRELGVPDEFAFAPKRAMQFGSRIAKLENRKEKATDQCARLISP